jgi:hypothetical protein
VRAGAKSLIKWGSWLQSIHKFRLIGFRLRLGFQRAAVVLAAWAGFWVCFYIRFLGGVGSPNVRPVRRAITEPEFKTHISESRMWGTVLYVFGSVACNSSSGQVDLPDVTPAGFVDECSIVCREREGAARVPLRGVVRDNLIDRLGWEVCRRPKLGQGDLSDEYAVIGSGASSVLARMVASPVDTQDVAAVKCTVIDEYQEFTVVGD